MFRVIFQPLVVVVFSGQSNAVVQVGHTEAILSAAGSPCRGGFIQILKGRRILLLSFHLRCFID